MDFRWWWCVSAGSSTVTNVPLWCGCWWLGRMHMCGDREYMGNLCIFPLISLWTLNCSKKLVLILKKKYRKGEKMCWMKKKSTGRGKYTTQLPCSLPGPSELTCSLCTSRLYTARRGNFRFKCLYLLLYIKDFWSLFSFIYILLWYDLLIIFFVSFSMLSIFFLLILFHNITQIF